MVDEAPKVEFVKKPSRRPANLRKRELETEDSKDEAVTITKRIDMKEDDSEEQKTESSGISKLDVFFSAQGTASPSEIERKIAVATAEYDTSAEADRARAEIKIKATNAKTAGVDTEYRGQAGYRSFITIKDTARANAGSAKSRVAGPVRAVSNIRMTCRFDYAPDLCKDYNETGFCGFGDSCKFVHDRGDYKSGWELEQEWEAAQRGHNQSDEQFLVEQAIDEPARPEGSPESCQICEGEFRKPIVVTKCGHYFCERCALGHARKETSCFVCRSPINGQFQIYKAPKS